MPSLYNAGGPDRLPQVESAKRRDGRLGKALRYPWSSLPYYKVLTHTSAMSSLSGFPMATGLNSALRLSGSRLRPPYFFPAGFRVTKMPAFKSTSMSRPSSLNRCTAGWGMRADHKGLIVDLLGGLAGRDKKNLEACIWGSGVSAGSKLGEHVRNQMLSLSACPRFAG